MSDNLEIDGITFVEYDGYLWMTNVFCRPQDRSTTDRWPVVNEKIEKMPDDCWVDGWNSHLGGFVVYPNGDYRGTAWVYNYEWPEGKPAGWTKTTK